MKGMLDNIKFFFSRDKNKEKKREIEKLNQIYGRHLFSHYADMENITVEDIKILCESGLGDSDIYGVIRCWDDYPEIKGVVDFNAFKNIESIWSPSTVYRLSTAILDGIDIKSIHEKYPELSTMGILELLEECDDDYHILNIPIELKYKDYSSVSVFFNSWKNGVNLDYLNPDKDGNFNNNILCILNSSGEQISDSKKIMLKEFSHYQLAIIVEAIEYGVDYLKILDPTIHEDIMGKALKEMIDVKVSNIVNGK